MRLRLAFLLLLVARSGLVPAHELQFQVTAAPAAVIQLRYADGQPFAFEAYALYPGTAEMPAQVGRTDAQGRLVFLPEGKGEWRLKAFAADGHGLDQRLQVAPADGDALPAGTPEAGLERFARVILGLSLILGSFGLYQLFICRKRKAQP